MSEVSEVELQAKAVAPRVTKDQIDALMATVSVRFERPEGTTSTFAHVYMGQFYLASGHSACISVENYDQEIGERIARGNAIKKATDQLWQMEGYALYKQLNQPAGSHIDRLVMEQNVLQERMGKLIAFMDTQLFKDLPSPDRDLLDDQLSAMAMYNQVLLKRILRGKTTV